MRKFTANATNMIQTIRFREYWDDLSYYLGHSLFLSKTRQNRLTRTDGKPTCSYVDTNLVAKPSLPPLWKLFFVHSCLHHLIFVILLLVLLQINVNYEMKYLYNSHLSSFFLFSSKMQRCLCNATN